MSKSKLMELGRVKVRLECEMPYGLILDEVDEEIIHDLIEKSDEVHMGALRQMMMDGAEKDPVLDALFNSSDMEIEFDRYPEPIFTEEDVPE